MHRVEHSSSIVYIVMHICKIHFVYNCDLYMHPQYFVPKNLIIGRLIKMIKKNIFKRLKIMMPIDTSIDN